ncbi:MAG: prepilin-type N-terminal cleavage/methylation domain-containing protein [Desulfuromonas sp.]|nr:prepilin-type N-terminal cleavage/methylation domain-containing protein [Desulfuromonas sp.]
MKTHITINTKCNGFTLIEVLIALAISGLLMTAVYSAFDSQQKSYLAQEQVTEVQQNIRAGITMMVEELRMAGYNPYGTGTASFIEASATQCSFTFVADSDDIDNDNADGDNDISTGADETGELKTVTYDLYDAYGDGIEDIGRQVGSSNTTKRAIAEHINNLEFIYLDADGERIADTSTAGGRRNIRSVQISVLARTDRPDRNYTNTQTYTPASGDATWGPYDDNFRRRFQIITIQCRNMES